MAAYRVKKDDKIYPVKAFSSLVQLAQRGLLDANDPIYVDQLGRWVRAGAINELKSHLKKKEAPAVSQEPAWSKVEAQKAVPVEAPPNDPMKKTDGAIELPLAYVEEVSEDELSARRERYQSEMRELLESRNERQSQSGAPRSTGQAASTGGENPKVNPSVVLSADLPRAVSLRKTSRDQAIKKPDPFDGMTFDAMAGKGKGAAAPKSSSGLTVESDSEGSSLGRMAAFILIPVIVGVLGIWWVNSRANERFEAVTQVAVEQPVEVKPPKAPLKSIASEEEQLEKERELALRRIVPLKLRQPITKVEQLQDDIFAELLNGGGYPKKVTVAPLMGEVPAHAALRKLDVNVAVVIGESSGMDTEDQLALVSLIVGKYIKTGGLKVNELVISLDDTEIENTLSGMQVKDFYSRKVKLAEFLTWVDY